MTLDEAIKYAEEVAEANERSCKAKPHANLESYLECAAEHRQLAEWLKELKQLGEQTRWIPVSERLPEKNMACLVAVGNFNLTEIAMYSNLMGILDHRIFYQGDVGYDSFEDITQYVNAWMPLPQSYKAESEDKE